MAKSISVFTVLFVIVLLQYNLLCQKKLRPDNEFYGSWLREDYYNGLKKHKTPEQLFKIVKGVMSVYFDEKTNVMSLDWNYHEGIGYKYSIISNKKLKITIGSKEQAGYWAELIKEDNQTKLVLNDFKKKLKFIKLDKKYSFPYSGSTFINDIFFNGDYAVNGDTQKKVTFTSDGKVNGWDNYTHYVLNLNGIVAPKYDVIWLQVRKEGKIKKVLPLHWEKTGNKIEFFSLSDDSPYAVIKDKYIELIKIQ